MKKLLSDKRRKIDSIILFSESRKVNGSNANKTTHRERIGRSTATSKTATNFLTPTDIGDYAEPPPRNEYEHRLHVSGLEIHGTV